jgi:hypothetical protein
VSGPRCSSRGGVEWRHCRRRTPACAPPRRIALETPYAGALPDADVIRSLAALVLDARGASDAVETLAFTLKQRSIDAKAINADLRIGLDTDETTIAALSRGIVPHLDFVVMAAPRAESIEVTLGGIRDASRRGFDALAPPDSAAAR